MRYTNLRGQNARDVLIFMRDNDIGCNAKLERELENGSRIGVLKIGGGKAHLSRSEDGAHKLD